MYRDRLKIEIDELKKTLEDGLLSTIIFEKDNDSAVVEYNSVDNSTKAYNRLINSTLEIFREYRFDNIDKYMLFHLENDGILIILPLYNYRWVLLIDNNRVKLGSILNIIIPNTRKKFENIIKVT